MNQTLATAAERLWGGDSAGARALGALLVPAAAAYGGAVVLRNWLYDAGWLGAARIPARVISVGNLTVGGTGKTPAALWLAEALARRGQRVGIVARGYRKRRRGVVVVGSAGRPLVTAEEGGDEAVLLARRFPGPVVTGERRAEAARVACARFGLDTIVLDDGFQHRALARDTDLVILAEDPRRVRLLPAGPLREGPAALARASAFLLMNDTPAVPGAPAFRGRLVARALVRAEGDAWVEEPLAALAGVEVIALAGIARPERLVAALAAAGARVQRLLRFPDHHRYGASDLATIAAAAREAPVVTTEKDLTKLGGIPCRALRVALEVEDGEALVDLLAGPAG